MPELWRITYITTADQVTHFLKGLAGHVSNLELNPVDGTPELLTRVVPAEMKLLPAVINGSNDLETPTLGVRDNSARGIMLKAIRAANGGVVTTKQLKAVLKRAGKAGSPGSLGMVGLIEHGLVKRVSRGEYAVGDGNKSSNRGKYDYTPRPGTAAHLLLEMCRQSEEVTAKQYGDELKKRKKNFDSASITNLIRHGLIRRIEYGRYAAAERR